MTTNTKKGSAKSGAKEWGKARKKESKATRGHDKRKAIKEAQG